MPTSQLNPYDPPQSAAPAPSSGGASGLNGAVVRSVVMALIGFGAFTAFGLAFWAISDVLDENATLPWALSVGAVGALLFATSEVFNAGDGKRTGVLRRVLVTTGVFIASSVATVMLSQILGWNPRRYEEDPWWLHRMILEAALFFAVIAVVRILWIGRVLATCTQSSAEQ